MPESAPPRSARTARAPKRYAPTQRMMFAAITRRLEYNGMQSTWTDGSDMARHAELFIKPNDRLSSFERLQIYNQQYWWRLIESFSEDFRGLCAVIGEVLRDRRANADPGEIRDPQARERLLQFCHRYTTIRVFRRRTPAASRPRSSP